MAKQLLFDEKARLAIKRGVDQLANAVKVTLGPRGRHVILDKGFGSPVVTNDGVTIAKEIELEDKFENVGAQLVQEVASKTDDVAGDGTTTATVLAQAIIREGLKNVAAGANPQMLKKGLEKAVEVVVEALKKMAKKVDGLSDLSRVAAISSGSEEIGKVIAEAMEKVGKDGVVTVEEGLSFGIQSEISEGLQFDKGYINPYMVTNPERMEASYNDVPVLLSEKKISALQDILPLLEKLAQSGRKEIVIIAEDVEGEALATFVVNKIRGTFSVLAVKAPSFGDRRKDILKDIATVVGGTVVSEELGMKLETVGLEVLGQAHKIISTKENTTIVGGKGEKKEIAARIEAIKKELMQTESDFEREKLQERLAKLAGGVAVIKVGAATETEMKEIKYKIEDAVKATKAAEAEGIVVGGGVALIRTLDDLNKLENDLTDRDEKLGVTILKRALEEPLRQLAENGGKDGGVIADQVKKATGNMGYNVRTHKLEDLMEAGVIDPVKVTKSALQNAASIAGMFITTEVVVTDLPKKEDEKNGHDHGGGDYGY